VAIGVIDKPPRPQNSLARSGAGIADIVHVNDDPHHGPKPEVSDAISLDAHIEPELKTVG
jgi:hypothetical protein